MAHQNGIGLEFKIDADQLLATPTATPNFTELNVIEVSNSFNETVDSFYKLNNEGYANNVVTALDPEFGITIKYDADDTVGNNLYAKRFGTARTFPFEITDPITSETIAFDGTVTSISDTRNVDSVVEFSMTIKLNGKPTITAS